MSLWAVLGISFTIMYYQLGIYATLAGFLASFLFVPLQVYIGKCILNIRFAFKLKHFHTVGIN